MRADRTNLEVLLEFQLETLVKVVGENQAMTILGRVLAKLQKKADHVM